MVASHAQGSHAEHHSVMWRAGDTHRYISHSVAGYPATIVTNGTHSFSPGDTIRISQHLGSVPDINGDYRILDVLSSTTLRIDVSLNTGGTAGRVNSYSDVVMGIDGVITKPSAPLLVYPDDDVHDLEPTVTFQWTKADKPSRYRIQLSTFLDFSSIYFDATLYDTIYTVSDLSKGTQYYWRVRAENIDGGSEWTEPRTFTTIEDLPEIPQLVSPVDGEIGVDLNPLLEWSEAERAELYRVQLSSNSNFTAITFDADSILGTSVTVNNLVHEDRYYWRVQSINSSGESGWSAVWSFTTVISPPSVPQLVSPADGAVNISVDTLLVWQPSDRARSYQIHVATDQDFSDIILNKNDLNDTNIEINGLENITMYFWRVRAENDGGVSGWSAVRHFTTSDVSFVNHVSNGIPTDFALEQNYPNPFNPATTIRFALPIESTVRFDIFNILGQRVATLINREQYSAGYYEVVWDARDEFGRELSSGIYIGRISTDAYNSTIKMILAR
jgi:hypothetical protein